MLYPEVVVHFQNYLADKISIAQHLHIWIITDIPNTISAEQFRHLCDIGNIANVKLLRSDYTDRKLASYWCISGAENLEQFINSRTKTWKQFVNDYYIDDCSNDFDS